MSYDFDKRLDRARFEVVLAEWRADVVRQELARAMERLREVRRKEARQ